MYKLEKLNSIFNCKVCFHLLHDPILLPCGKTICKSHSSEVNESQCLLCPETHIMPINGFPMNEAIQELLEIELNKLNINFNQFDECKLLIRELKTSLNDLETLEIDPASYITEQFQELNRQVDLRREKLLLEIHNGSNQLIKEIEIAHKECLAAVNFKSPISDNIKICKRELDAVQIAFDSFEIDGKKCEEILVRSTALKERLRPMIKNHKRELLINQTFQLTTPTHEIKLDQIFGSFEIKGVRIFDNFLNIFNFF